ncbi:unnamed protein product [Rhizoctonia solani]|nr:unnamed protein product [Rhizoctonia solani]
MKTESTPPKDPPTPPSGMAKATSTSPATATTALADDGAPRAKKAGVGPVRTRAAPSKTFVCRGFGDCSMVFSRSEHLARHHAQTVHSDKGDLNERMMRDLTSLHTALAASSHRNLPRLSPSQATASQGSRSQPSTPNDSHPPSAGVVPSMAYESWRRDDFSQESFLGGQSFRTEHQHQSFRTQHITIPSAFPPGHHSYAPLSDHRFQPAASDFHTHASGRDSIGRFPSTNAQHVHGSFERSHPGRDGYERPLVDRLDTRDRAVDDGGGSKPFTSGGSAGGGLPPISSLIPPSPVGGLPPDLSDALPPRPAVGSRPSMDARVLLPGPRQPLHHSASDPQLHRHARGRAVVPASSIGVGMYSPLSRQHWLPQDTTMGMAMIDRQGIEMMSPLGPLASHLDSGLGLHPRPPSTERDGAESGSGSELGMDATSRLSVEVDAASLNEMEMAMNADIMARGDMSTQRSIAGMSNDWPLAMLLHPQTGHPMHRWNPDVESLEGFTQETRTERSDYYRPTAEATTRRFPTIHRDSLPANGRMTLGLEMPEPTQGPHLDDLPSWNYAQPSPHSMIMPQGLHSAFRPMASPPLSGGGSPRPSFDLRLRTRYTSEPGQQQQARSAQRFATPTSEGTHYPHHPLHPQQPWDAGMMTVLQQDNENANANDYSSDGIQFTDLTTTNPTTDTNGERAYPTPLSAHPRLPVTGENANGSEVKYEHPSPHLLPLPE